jgi:hypothetical protein
MIVNFIALSYFTNYISISNQEKIKANTKNSKKLKILKSPTSPESVGIVRVVRPGLAGR